jgi:hypothetical protein
MKKTKRPLLLGGLEPLDPSWHHARIHVGRYQEQTCKQGKGSSISSRSAAKGKFSPFVSFEREKKVCGTYREKKKETRCLLQMQRDRPDLNARNGRRQAPALHAHRMIMMTT